MITVAKLCDGDTCYSGAKTVLKHLHPIKDYIERFVGTV